MTTETESKPVLLRTLQVIDLAQVSDNPWQPRSSLDAGKTKELAESIKEVGLLQNPLVRLVEGGYQVAFGHYRIAALRSLGYESAELEVKSLTDTEMAIIALTENGKRTEVPPLEQYRAWQKALEIDGMTPVILAGKLGVNQDTITGNLRLLKLPPYVLAHVDSGEMAARAAREFLCLRGEDGHFHDDIAKAVLGALVSGKTPDWRQARIRLELNEQMRHQSTRDWRKLFKGHGGGGHAADPLFDMTVFKSLNGDQVHAIANDEWSGATWMPGGDRSLGKVVKEGTRDWTCSPGKWLAANKRATTGAKGVVTAAAKSAEAKAPGKSADFVKTLAADPVFKTVDPATSGPLLKTLKAGELDEEAAKALGTRAAPVEVKTDKSFFKAVVDERGFNEQYGMNLTRVPSYFADIKECREKCTIGATYGRFAGTGALTLFCLNQEHFEEKVAKGKAAAVQKLKKRKGQLDGEDKERYDLLTSKWPEMPAAVASLLASVLIANAGRYSDISPEDRQMSYEDVRALSLQRANVERIYELTQAESQNGYLDKRKALMTLMTLTSVRELTLRLLVEELSEPTMASFVSVLAAPELPVT